MGQTGSKTHLGHFGVGSVICVQWIGTHTLKSAFKLDGALYYQKEKLSNITVKEEKKKSPYRLQLILTLSASFHCIFPTLFSHSHSFS